MDGLPLKDTLEKLVAGSTDGEIVVATKNFLSEISRARKMELKAIERYAAALDKKQKTLQASR